MNARGATLSAHVSVRPRFARSINVERDTTLRSLDGYILTGRTLEILRRLSGSFLDPSFARAISATGPYGSGKSSMAVFLDALLGSRKAESNAAAEEKLGNADKELLRQFRVGRKTLGADPEGFIRGAVVASAEPVEHTLLRAMVSGARRFFAHRSPSSKVVRQLLALDLASGGASRMRRRPPLREAIEALTEVAPVILIIDEFGRNLNHFVQSAGVVDLHCL